MEERNRKEAGMKWLKARLLQVLRFVGTVRFVAGLLLGEWAHDWYSHPHKTYGTPTWLIALLSGVLIAIGVLIVFSSWRMWKMDRAMNRVMKRLREPPRPLIDPEGWEFESEENGRLTLRKIEICSECKSRIEWPFDAKGESVLHDRECSLYPRFADPTDDAAWRHAPKD